MLHREAHGSRLKLKSAVLNLEDGKRYLENPVLGHVECYTEKPMAAGSS